MSLRGVLRGLARPRTAAAVAVHEARYAGGTAIDAGEGAARYYDLVTDFYEYGWGPSFHFAPRRTGESLAFESPLPDELARLVKGRRGLA